MQGNTKNVRVFSPRTLKSRRRLTASAVALTLLAVLLAVTACAGGDSKNGEPRVTEQPDIVAPANRLDCEQIRGTDYLSPEEREWFLGKCIADPDVRSGICAGGDLEFSAPDWAPFDRQLADPSPFWNDPLLDRDLWSSRDNSTWATETSPGVWRASVSGSTVDLIQVVEYTSARYPGVHNAQGTPDALGCATLAEAGAAFTKAWDEFQIAWIEQLKDRANQLGLEILAANPVADYRAHNTAYFKARTRGCLLPCFSDGRVLYQEISMAAEDTGVTRWYTEYIAPSAEYFEVYRSLDAIATSSDSDDRKDERARVVQSNYGESLLTEVVRLIPVVSLDGGSPRVETADTWLRELAQDYELTGSSPIESDPVGAAMRILFDPSTDTISSMLGLDDFR